MDYNRNSPYQYNDRTFRGSMVFGRIFDYIGFVDPFGPVIAGLNLLMSTVTLLKSKTGTIEAKVYTCPVPDDFESTTIIPGPLNNGESEERKNGTIRKAPPIDDIDSWCLQALYKLSREEIERGLETFKFLVCATLTLASFSFSTFAVGAIASGSITRAVANYGISCLTTYTTSKTSSKEFKDEIDYALKYQYVSYNSTMTFTVYFDKDNYTIAVSRPSVDTN